jgi:nanoRNase/pAp phosphatase (c-di-AMP/oligoRNAs hydrolase)
MCAYCAYKDIIGRAENKALVRYLGHPLRRLAGPDLRQSVPIAFIDTQPGAGNNALPPKSTVAIVLDHHPWREAAAAARFADVRPNIGATSTILTEYLQAGWHRAGAIACHSPVSRDQDRYDGAGPGR